jgi:hypothetical protein
VLGELPGISPVTAGHAIKATRRLPDGQKITITPTVVRYFTRAQDLRGWLGGTHHIPPTVTAPARHALTGPQLTGMNRETPHQLLEDLMVPYAPAIEQRRHRQRGGNRRPGTRTGVSRQKTTDGDRILATLLHRRRVANPDALADLSGVCRSTLWNAIRDVQPILDDHRCDITPAPQQHPTAREVLDTVRHQIAS